jgi:hypothetical protein
MLLILPLLLGYVVQATQYARAPVDYNYYVVYAKNADIAIQPGVDKSPDGDLLLRNSTNQEGLYTIRLGQWAPGYRVNYTDGFRIVNREVFNIRMIGFNYSAPSIGQSYINIYVQNDTDNDGAGDVWVFAWDGTSSTLSPTNYIYLKQADSYGNNGGVAKVKVMINIPATGVGLSQGTPQLDYSGTMYMWFTSAEF